MKIAILEDNKRESLKYCIPLAIIKRIEKAKSLLFKFEIDGK